MNIQATATLPQPIQTFLSFADLQQILDSCPYVSLVLNEQRRIVFFNRALSALAGSVSPDVMFGKLFGQAMECSHAYEGAGCGTTPACQTCGAHLAVKEGLSGITGTRECRLIRE